MSSIQYMNMVSSLVIVRSEEQISAQLEYWNAILNK